MDSNISMKPKWLNLPLAMVLGLSAIGVAVHSFYFIVDHYSWNLDNAIGSPFFERTIRAPVKAFFDTHFFIATLTFLSYPVFGVERSSWFFSGSIGPANRIRTAIASCVDLCMRSAWCRLASWDG